MPTSKFENGDIIEIYVDRFISDNPQFKSIENVLKMNNTFEILFNITHYVSETSYTISNNTLETCDLKTTLLFPQKKTLTIQECHIKKLLKTHLSKIEPKYSKENIPSGFNIFGKINSNWELLHTIPIEDGLSLESIEKAKNEARDWRKNIEDKIKEIELEKVKFKELLSVEAFY